MDPFRSALERVSCGKNLTTSECQKAIASIVDGGTSDAAAAAFLTAIRIKGETADELAGAVAAVRERMIHWDSGVSAESLLDTCGTGGDGARTVNISTAAAIVVAACGSTVVKHGNKSATSSSGSSDVLTALGVATDPGPDLARNCLAELKIAFLFAPTFHPGLVRLAPLRRELPFRTVFNLVGPLCNPACPARQLVGVPSEAQADLLAAVLARQAHVHRAVVVTGSDGLDEVTLDGATLVRVVEPPNVRRVVWEPDDFGLARESAAAIKVSDAVESAKALTSALDGERGPVRDYILANSAAALWVARGSSLRESMSLAATAIDSGAAAKLLAKWKQLAPAARAPMPA